MIARQGRQVRWTQIPFKWAHFLHRTHLILLVRTLPVHDPDDDYAENIARNVGSGGWGQLYSPDKILGRFVEREEGRETTKCTFAF